MKKLLLFMATAVMTASMQGAKIQWTTGPLYAPNATTGAYTTVLGTGVTGYVATVTFYTYNTGTSSYDLVTSVTGNSNNVTVKGGAIQGEASNFDAGTTYYASIYIIDPTGKWYLQTNYLPVPVPAAGDGGASFSFGTSGNWLPVPEPATMALLGIGVVAVGLRRRRK